MNENNPSIPELYTKFERLKHPSFPDKIITSLVQKLRKHPVDEQEELRYQIEKELRHQPGKYPLDKLIFHTDPTTGQEGFDYGFKQKIGKYIFNADFWSYNRWGILVQKHEKSFSPQIEISKDKEDLRYLLHLPDGYQIPVGPIYYKEDRRPMTQAEWEAQKAKALKIAKAAGIKLTKETIKISDEIADKTGAKIKHIGRYFYWQPLLEDETPIRIGIDFDAIKPSEMGLKPENAPVFHQTKQLLSPKRI